MFVLLFLSAAVIGVVFAVLGLTIRWRLPERHWSILPVAAAGGVVAVLFLAIFERVWSRLARPADLEALRTAMRVIFALAFAGLTVSIHRRAAWVDRDLLIESLVGMGTFMLYFTMLMVVGLLLLSQAVIA